MATNMEKVYSYSTTETDTKERIQMANQKAAEPMLGATGRSTRENSRTDSDSGMEFGSLGPRSMREPMSTTKEMVKGSILGKAEATIRELSWKT